jgi:hypothetical protein
LYRYVTLGVIMFRQYKIKIILIIILYSLFSLFLYGQSRIPENSNLWLQITENPNSGSRDSVQTVFFEVPDSYLGPIYFGICDPEGDTDSPDQIQQAAWDSGTTYQLFMGDGAYTGANARQIFYADPAPADPDNNPPVNHDVDGTCPPGFIYEYDETNTAVQGGQSVTGDGQWVYFPVVYASQGEKVGTNRYFRMVIHADEGLDSDFKNGYQLIASKTTGTTPTEITEIRAFAYAWSVDFQNGFTWDFYPFVPDSAGATDELDLFFNDVDGEGIYTLYDIQGNTIDNTTAPGNGIWSSDTDGATDYTFGSQINGTWHLEFPIAGGGPAENTTEIWAENSLTNETLPIYSSFFKPAEPYRVVAYHDPTETGVNRKVILQLVDDSDNPVPYVRNIFIENPSTTLQIRDDLGALIGTVGAGDSYTITTNSDGFAVFTCSNSADEIVTLNFVTDGVRSDTEGPTTCSRLPLSGALGPNNSVQIAFETGSRPTLSSNAVSIVEGNIAAGINFTVTETFGGYITAGNDIYIRIPDTVDAVFNASVPVIGGSASGKVDTVVSYPDSKTMRLNVNTTLAAADTVTISGLDFTSTNTASSGDFELSYSGYTGPYSVIDSASTGFDIVISSDAYFVWDGSTDGDLTVNANWVGGTAPDLTLGGPHTAKVILTSAGAVPLLDTNYYFRELIIDAGAIPIASGTTLLDVNTSYQNNGTLSISGTNTDVSFSGNAFSGLPSLGDVILNDTATGAINYWRFDNFTVTNGTWNMGNAPDYFVFYGDVTLSATSDLDLNFGDSFNLYGNWTNNGATISSSIPPRPIGGILNLMGTKPATITGDSSLFQLNCTVPGKQIYFESGSVQTIVDQILLTGSSSSPIFMRGTTNALWTIDNQASTVDISHVDVDWAEAATADISCDYSLIRDTTTIPAGNSNEISPRWINSGTVYTWNGITSTAVGTATNWTPNGIPGLGDSVIIEPGATFDPLLTGIWNLGTGHITINNGGILSSAGFAITCVDLIVSAGGTLDMAGSAITNGNIQNDGTINAQAGASLSAALNSDSGTVNYSGGGAALPLGNSYYNLTFSGGVWTPAAGVIVNRDLTVTAGSFGTNAQTLTLAGDILLSGGTLDINTNFTLNGDLLNTGGTFTHTGAGNVITISGGTHLISGSNSWRSISSTVGNTVLRFQDGTTQTLAEDLTVTGTAGNLITIKGTSTAGWDMDITGTVNATYADISYSTATSGPHDAFFSQSSYSNNTGWNIFPGATASYTWQGDDATNPTLWSVAENWDTGSVPIGAAQVIIPNVVNDPVLTANVTIDTLAIQAGGVLDTDGFDLVLGTPASFSNDGILILTGDETTLTLTMDTNTGLVRYKDGTGAGTISFTTFNDLEIAGTAQTHSLSGNTTVNGSLSVTSGTLGGTAQSLTVTGNAVLDSDLSFSGVADLTFNGGVSSLTGDVTSTGGIIIVTGMTGDLTMTGSLNAGTGTVDLTLGANSLLDIAAGDTTADITANTINIAMTGPNLGNAAPNWPLDTASPGLCIMTLPSGSTAIAIDHTGDLSVNFGGNRIPGVASALQIEATGALTLPGNTIDTDTTVMTLTADSDAAGGGLLSLPAACNLTSSAGNITLSGDTMVLAAGAISASGAGTINISVASGNLTMGKNISSGSGNLFITTSGGFLDLVGTVGTAGDVTLTAAGNITQTGAITTNDLIASTTAAGALINLDTVNIVDTIDLQSFDSGNITYVDTDGFDIAGLATTGDVDLTCTAASADDGTADVTQSAAMSLGGLVLRGTGDYLFDANNSITSIAASVTGDIYFRDNDGFAISAVGGVNGLTATGDIYLRNNSVFGFPEVSQTQPIVCNGLVLHGNPGDFVLTLAGNSVNTLAISGQGTSGNIDVSYAQDGNLTLGQVNVSGTTVTGCTEGRNLTLNLGTGDLIIDDAIVPDWILAGDFTLTADDFDDSLSNTVPGANISTGGNVTLNLANAAPTAQTNTWIFNGTTALTIVGNPISLNNIQLGDGTAGGSLTLSAAQDINGNITALNNGATTLDLGGQTVTLGGNLTLTNLDTLTAAGSTLTLNGAGPQTLTSNGLSLNNLTINAAGVTVADNLTMTGNLTLTAGNLDIDGNNLAVTGTLFNNTNLLLTGAGWPDCIIRHHGYRFGYCYL